MILIHTDIYCIYPFPKTIRLLQNSWFNQTFNEWSLWKNQAETTSPCTSSTTKCLDHFSLIKLRIHARRLNLPTKLMSSPFNHFQTSRPRILFILQWRSSETKTKKTATWYLPKRGPFQRNYQPKIVVWVLNSFSLRPGVIQVGRVWSLLLCWKQVKVAKCNECNKKKQVTKKNKHDITL